MTNKTSPFIGLIGFGYWGKNILRNLSELGVLHTACDSNSNLISEQKKLLSHIKFTTSFDDVLQNREIKAVAISTPAETHAKFVKESLLAGKDVFVEKPLALTVKDGKELVELAGRHNKILMVGHILQYHPAVIKLKELISSGKIGKIQYIYSNRLNIGKFRTEENILWSFAPHDISVILLLLGEEPLNIMAFGEGFLNKEVYDTTLTSMVFSNGVKGHIFVSWLHPFKEQKIIVVGSEAMAVFDDLNQNKLCIYPHKIEWKDGKIPTAHKADFKEIPIKEAEPLREELKHFIECVNERKSPKTDGEEGLRILKVLEEAEESLSRTFRGAKRGNPGQRRATKEVGMTLPAEGALKKQYFVHESSFIDEEAKIGNGTKIWHFAHVSKKSTIGSNCIIGQNVMIGSEVEIGDKCKIQNNVSIYKGVVIEDEVFCGPSCVFTNVYNPRAFIERKHEFMETLVKKGATIGANATIICGVIIGRFTMVGAGAVVKADVPDYAVVAGVPAKQIGWVCKCGTKLNYAQDPIICKHCGDKYRLEDNKLSIVV